MLFRHDKRFVNPCVFALEIKDTLSEAEIDIKIQEVLDSEIDRVGQKLRIDAIALKNTSNDAGRFESAAKIVAAKAPEVPVIICATDPQAAETAAVTILRQETNHLRSKFRKCRSNGRHCKDI